MEIICFVFGICKCTYFDLHEYEGLKDQLFKFVFVLNCKKRKQKKKLLWIKVQRKQIYIEKKDPKKTGSSTQLFVAILFVVY